MQKDIVFYKSSLNVSEVADLSVDLIITSPPYFNIKDYSKNGYQSKAHSNPKKDDLGAINSYKDYIKGLLKVWSECERVLKPNGKLCINVPLMPMLKKDLNTHYNRHIFDLQSDIQHSVLQSFFCSICIFGIAQIQAKSLCLEATPTRAIFTHKILVNSLVFL